MLPLDRLDRRILNILQADGRMTNAELAERVGLSASACLRRVKLLEDAGVIEGYRAMLKPSAVDCGTDVFVEITLESLGGERQASFERQVSAMPEVMECHLMAGDCDYLLRVVVGSTEDYERLHRDLSRLAGVSRIRSSFAMRRVVRKTALPLSDL
jgi:Lrp/AsnC family transcriptional regulator, leucine-responsive regulatory protein